MRFPTAKSVDERHQPTNSSPAPLPEVCSSHAAVQQLPRGPPRAGADILLSHPDSDSNIGR